MSNVARIRELLGEPRRYPLYFAFSTYFTPVVAAIFLGVVLGPALDVVLGRALDQSQLLELTVVVAVLTVTARVLFIAKRQGKVEVELDAEGIRELDDGVVRVAIPWEHARASGEAYRVLHRKQRIPEHHVDVRFANAEGDIIALTDYDRSQSFPGFHFRCVARRALSVEKEIADLLPTLPKDTPDPREKEEHGSGVARFFRRLAFFVAWLSLVFFCGRIHEGGPMPYVICGFFTILWGLAPGLELIPQVKRWSRWSARVSGSAPTDATNAVADPYRAPGRRDEADGYARLMTRRALWFVRGRAALFLIALLLPWLAGYMLMRACLNAWQGREDPSYHCR